MATIGIVAWHLPFYGWTLDSTVKPGEKLVVKFTADKLITPMSFWVGGSDDAVIWDDTHTMLEDEFGIFDATLGTYVAPFFERPVMAKARHVDD